MHSDNLVFDIKRYAINDGPGIRLVIFFKGCNLRCTWCHNPESISPRPELLYTAAKCIGCGSCVAACAEKALSLMNNGIIIDFSRCTVCGICAGICPAKALDISGKRMKADEIMEIIEKERVFFDQSGGGVTFSGGEPLLHTNILFSLLDECGSRGIHRAVDTAGNVRTQVLLEAARRTDLFLYDLKVMDPGKHSHWTGTDNTLILHNLQVLSASGVKIIIRIPIIGGVNDDEYSIRQFADFIAHLEGEKKEVHLLPYHTIAKHKFAKLGREESFVSMEEPDSETLKLVAGWFKEVGIPTRVGG